MKRKSVSTILVVLTLYLTVVAAPMRAGVSTVFVVNSTGNQSDGDPSDGICDTGNITVGFTGICTLRAALEQADQMGGATIHFNIGGGSLQVIHGGGSASTPVIVDGTTQPGFAGHPLIVVAGGLAIEGGNSTVRGLVINNSVSFGLGVSGNGNLVTGNYIGTDPTGTIAQANLGGIDIVTGSNNTIQGNLISGNSDIGIVINGSPSTGNTIEGNYIGTDVTGLHALGNTVGVKVTNATTNTIGGTTPDTRNIISGNRDVGVETSVTATGNRVEGNYIGADATGAVALPNGDGVIFNSPGNTLGGTTPGAGNLIAFNRTGGVFVLDSIFGHSINNAIRQNSIFSNTGLGIDLSGNSVTPNTPTCAAAGPNNLQNYPVLTSARFSSGSTTIQGTLNCTPGTSFTLDFFSNAACDPSGFGEGQTFLGSSNVTTDSSGNATISVTLSAGKTTNPFITATATDPNGNTSEFSHCIQTPGSEFIYLPMILR